eukprot:GILK01003602.1.p1 GENE.GILK01003602.1~~GILK01003602.1.p1  ORF type:complete len:422 (+),score=68.43 GILK01003602.1:33-1268(+)
MATQSQPCQVCFDNFSSVAQFKCTNDACTVAEKICKSCLVGYLESRFAEMNGYLSPVKCPTCFSHVKMSAWMNLLDDNADMLEAKEQKARSLMTVRCFSCHSVETILPPRGDFDKDDLTDFVSDIAATQGNKGLRRLRAICKAFNCNQMPANEFVKILEQEFYPHLDRCVFQDKVHYLMGQMPDFERRVACQMALIRNQNFFFRTRCCGAEMCWNCQSQGHVEGETCEDHLAPLEADTKTCYNCGVCIVVSEGCSHVVCICGGEICWGCGREYNNCRCGYEDEPREEEANQVEVQAAEVAASAPVNVMDLTREVQEPAVPLSAQERLEQLELDEYSGLMGAEHIFDETPMETVSLPVLLSHTSGASDTMAAPKTTPSSTPRAMSRLLSIFTTVLAAVIPFSRTEANGISNL